MNNETPYARDGFDLYDLTTFRSPDQVARKAHLERAGVALAVDQREARDGEAFDRADECDDGGLQFRGLRLVDTDEDLNVGTCGEVITLRSHQHCANVAAGSVIDSATQVGKEIPAEEVLWRPVDDDLAEVIGSLERYERHR